VRDSTSGPNCVAVNRSGASSAGGKTLVVASILGNVPAGVNIDGHEVIVGVNPYIKK
jgi:hypothetical protein